MATELFYIIVLLSSVHVSISIPSIIRFQFQFQRKKISNITKVQRKKMEQYRSQYTWSDFIPYNSFISKPLLLDAAVFDPFFSKNLNKMKKKTIQCCTEKGGIETAFKLIIMVDITWHSHFVKKFYLIRYQLI